MINRTASLMIRSCLTEICSLSLILAFFDILGIGPEQDAVQLRRVLSIKGLVGILFKLLVQHGLDLAL